jgi:alpha-galactosidase
MFGFLGSLARPLRRSVIFALAAGLVFYAAGTGSSRAAEIVLLSSLDVSKTVQSSGRVQINKSYVGRPLTIAGRRFEHGVGTHAISTLAIDLKGGADRFIAYVGVDDDNGKNVGTVEFRLIGDGRVLWRSGIMKTGDAAKPVDVDLKGIRSLILRVSDTRDGIDCDHADWAEAKFEVSGEKPETVAAPPMKQDRAVILTPKSPATPRINGAKAFSARPGHPYLFTIPATGQRPMEYAIDDLLYNRGLLGIVESEASSG